MSRAFQEFLLLRLFLCASVVNLPKIFAAGLEIEG